MSEGRVALTRDGLVATVLFHRPQAHNAMTWAMYDSLVDICRTLKGDVNAGVVMFRGAGRRAFISGTDIRQFTEITDGEGGLAYEARIDACVNALEALPQPTLALIDGWAVGGGLAIASACDFRLATPAARFGVPIARTVGNCLSMANTRRLLAQIGVARTKRLLMLGEMMGAEEARECGFVLDVVEEDRLEARAAELAEILLGHAPLTLRASKEMIRRIVQDETEGAGADLIAVVYGSEDFKTGVRAFIDKGRPNWQGS